ncbi:S46 family peptidase [Bacteroidota bacterium]
MKNYILMLILVFFIFKIDSIADEGMYLISLLHELDTNQLKEAGLELSIEDIYSINRSSLKDAIVIFGRGCTGEIISEEGLILTNHHCGYGAIQSHSTVENNYLKDGFWASTREEEIPTPDLPVTFLIKAEDVTEKVMSQISDSLTQVEKLDIIDEICLEIEEEVTNENLFHEATVKPMFEGNSYILFVYKKYNDVRFVGAPPSSIGKYGADTDNWMWPRHTCDFSLFRVYTDAEGNPAEYSEDNIPLKAKKHFPISLEGYDKNDFTFIMGFPGRTERYMTSFELEGLMEVINPNREKIRGVRQEILLEDMMSDEKIRIQYASKYSRSSNYWKFSIGQNKGLEKLNIRQKKLQQEEDFRDWINEDEARLEKYGEVLPTIEKSMKIKMPYTHAVQYLNECFKRSCEIFTMAQNTNSLYYTLKNGKNNIDEKIQLLQKDAKEFYKDYNPGTDKKVVIAMLKLFEENVDKNFHPDIYETIKKKYKGDYAKYVDKMFSNSVFADSTKFYSFLDNYNIKIIEKDLAFEAAMSIGKLYNDLYNEAIEYRNKIDEERKLYIAGLMEMDQAETFYPDANFTMRFTYGSVQDYYPKDAVHYDYYTTIDGVMEKEDPNNWEFIVPDKLKQLYQDKNYQPYDEDGSLKTCFISTNDITGGNSGSPVINGKGQLIGLAFDGNWEAMSGDIAFEPKLQRCINVDIRYVLFIIDKYAGASNLIDEMTIIE